LFERTKSASVFLNNYEHIRTIVNNIGWLGTVWNDFEQFSTTLIELDPFESICNDPERFRTTLNDRKSHLNFASTRLHVLINVVLSYSDVGGSHSAVYLDSAPEH